MSDEEEKLKKRREETDKRKLATQGAPGEANGSTKKRKPDRTQPDPALDDDLEDRLWIGLGILKALARLHQLF